MQSVTRKKEANDSLNMSLCSGQCDRLKNHQMAHSNKNTFTCETCLKIFKDATKLQCHEILHALDIKNMFEGVQ